MGIACIPDGALRPIQHDHLERVACAVGTENQVASRVFVDLFHDQ